MTSIKGLSKRVLLIILDGFGINKNTNKNAILDAKKPFIDELFKNYPFTTIEAGGELVGLPKGVAGNSEVGHLNLGAGSPVRQDLVRINEAIEKNTLREMPELKKLIEYARVHNNKVHLLGLLSDGNVHSHIKHIETVMNLLSEAGITIYFHAFMDGRDTPKENGIKYIEQLMSKAKFIFASMQGRSIGMDRDRRWEKIKHCYDTFIGAGEVTKLSPLEYIKAEYQKGIFDEFITPVLFDEKAKLEEKDALFFLNFRPDRARQITLALMDPNFNEFKVSVKPGYFLCMSPYVPDEVTLPILFDKEKIPGTLAEYLSKMGLKQFKIAETEKYAHVTYFFNGGEEKPFQGEERVLVPSPKEVKTYDLKPEMSAPVVTQKLIEAINRPELDVLICNYANSDMVGHTGNYSAAVRAIEALDSCLRQVIEEAKKQNVTVVITADHGNSDQMVYEDGSPHTSHTDAPVPFCVVHEKLKNKTVNTSGSKLALKDVAPTLLHILNVKKPDNMQGNAIYE